MLEPRHDRGRLAVVAAEVENLDACIRMRQLVQRGARTIFRAVIDEEDFGRFRQSV